MSREAHAWDSGERRCKIDPTFLQFVATATGTTGLAAFAIWLLNQARKDLQALVTQYAADNREDKILLLKTLDDASRSYTVLSSKIDSLASAVVVLSRNGTKSP